MQERSSTPGVADGGARPDRTRTVPTGDGRGGDERSEEITDVEGSEWWVTAKRAVSEFRDEGMTNWAAALTYYAVLSLFPALIVLVSLIGIFGQHPQTTNAILNIVGEFAPGTAVDTLEGTIRGVVQSSGGAGALLGVGLLAALWSASGYVGAFFKASNSIYEVEEGRPFLKRRPLQLALTAALLVFVAFAAVAFIVSGDVASAIGNQIGVGDTAVTVWDIAKWPVLLLAAAVGFSLLYYASPNVKQPRFRWLTPGGAIGIGVWIVATAAFALYVSNFGSYNETYGALGGVVIFLVWLWISNMALLFGAEFNSELERTRKIRAGMSPHKEPFLPERSPPEPAKQA